MSTYKIRVVAASDKDVFIGFHKASSVYCVFSLGDTHSIEVGDILIGDFHGHSAATFEAKNKTQENTPWIDLEDWESPIDSAISHLLRLNSPTTIKTSSKHLWVQDAELVAEIRKDILASLL